jgi:hypothetical protein
VVPYRGFGDAQLLGDFLVSKAAAYEGNKLTLSARELTDVMFRISASSRRFDG